MLLGPDQTFALGAPTLSVMLAFDSRATFSIPPAIPAHFPPRSRPCLLPDHETPALNVRCTSDLTAFYAGTVLFDKPILRDSGTIPVVQTPGSAV